MHDIVARSENTQHLLKLAGQVILIGQVEELALSIDRASPGNILFKSMLMYIMLPAAAIRIRRFEPDVIFLTEILPLMGLFLKSTCRTNVVTAYGDWHLHNMLGRKAWCKPLLWLAETLDRFVIKSRDGI